jgi:hypothetical protein
MNHNKSLFVCCLLLILSSTPGNAQYYFGEYINQSVTLRSDFPSKSVLVSNVLSNRVGDMSQVIGAAIWADSGRQLQYRSLLEFNYNYLPQLIINDPSLISTAELILSPVHAVISQNDEDKPGKLYVRRVLQYWDDTLTRWENQPLADSSRQVMKTIKVKNKNYPVSIDVTKLVMDMLRSGNNGFMICPENSYQQSIASGQLFASPQNDDENLRPLLVINYRQLAVPSYGYNNWNTIYTHQRTTNFTMMQPGAGPFWVTTPVNEPVKEPVRKPDKTIPVKH